jgi:hypothetical protein
MPLTTGSRPSERHVVWPTEGLSGPDRAVDPRPLLAWSDRFDFDAQRTTRVDHDRADDPRPQVRVVFRWESVEPQTLTMGDREWTLGGQEVPGGFVEIDDRGAARIKTWETDRVFDLAALRVDGPTLVLDAEAFDDEKRLDGREVGQSEPPADRTTSRFW